MDKAEVVFEKLAGAKLEALKAFGKGLFGMGKAETKASMKFIKTKAPYEGSMKIPISEPNKVKELMGKIDTPVKQRALETQVSKSTWTYGKRPVSVLSKEQLAENLAREKYMKSYGM